MKEVCTFQFVCAACYFASVSNSQVTPSSKSKSFKTIVFTRWVEKHSEILTFVELLQASEDTLNFIATHHNLETAAKAQSCLNSLCIVSFVASLVVLEIISRLLFPFI